MSILSALLSNPMVHFLSKLWSVIRAYGEDIKVASATIGIVVLGLKSVSFCRAKLGVFLNRRALATHLTSQAYTEEEIDRAMTYYIIPDCQNVDPSGAEDWKLNLPVRENAFRALDHILITRTESKHSLVLADSGMGKTSLLLNYAARHWSSRKRRSEFDLALVPLGQRDVEEQIKQTPLAQRRRTVLLLDALDEDPKAIENHRARLNELLQATKDFRHILITSRTQFFPKDEEIPAETGILKIGIIAAGESREYFFHKIYLSPFSEEQVQSFIRRRFKWWRRNTREEARILVVQIRDLTVRPMILAHIPDLLELGKAPAGSSFQSNEPLLSVQIYQELISAWLKREQPLVKNVKALEEFSQRLAINIIGNRQKRGGEKVTSEELDEVLLSYEHAHPETAQLVKHSLEKWQVRGRSLLNRDASGNWKFAHRSILEYLAAVSIFNGDISVPTIFLTDQIKQFIRELNEIRIRHGEGEKEIPLIPLVHLREDARTFANLEELYQIITHSSTKSSSQPVSVNCEVPRYGSFSNDLLAIVRRATARSLTKDQVDDLTAQAFKRTFPDRTYLGSTTLPNPRFVITDIVTGTKWLIYLNICFDGTSYFEELPPGEYQRRPTFEEARSLGQLLILQPEILAFAWEFVDTLRITTSDRIADERPIIVSYSFDGIKQIDEAVSTDSASILPGTSISLSTLVEIKPSLVRKSALTEAFEKGRAMAAFRGA